MTYNTINDAQTIAGAGGTVLAGRYRIVRQLGQGGMGSVWLAEDTQLDNKPFAIKMLPSILVSNKRAYKQLKDEALVAMKLTHPNIVTLRAFEENNGNPFLVMDYIDGQTLDDYLAEKGELSEAEVIRVLRPIAAALDYAHGEGVIHRDVKPANVMIRKDGHPFILDFGIAREIQETLTRVTGKLSSGTLLYMSPEQLNGEQPKPAQDVYSFAAMAYECLKGEPPFVRGAIEDQIKHKDPEPLDTTSSSPKIGEVVEGRRGMAIAAFVMAGLAKKPENRPKNCVAVLETRKANDATGPAGSRGTNNTSGNPSSWEDRPKSSRIPIGTKHDAIRTNWGALIVSAGLVVLCTTGYVGWSIHDRRVRQERAALEDAKCKEDARQKALAQLRTEMEEIWAKAKGIEAVIANVSKDDGFGKQVLDFRRKFSEAEAFREANRYGDAAVAFSNALEYAAIIIKLDDVRNQAIAERDMAESTKSDADKSGSTSFCPDDYGRAQKILNDAYDLMRKRDFKNAKCSFGSAKDSFAKCATEARSEKLRRDEYLASRKNTMEEAKRQALAKWELVKTVPVEYGFREERQKLEGKLKEANRLADDSKWDDAARKYVEMKDASDKFLELDKERQMAQNSRTEALEASKEAAKAGAKKYAIGSWNEVTNGSWKQAEEYLKNRNFLQAKDSFDIACDGYRQCIKTARDKKRELDTAEQLRKDVQEANRKAEERRKAMPSLSGRWMCSTTTYSHDLGGSLFNLGNADGKIVMRTEYKYDFNTDGSYTKCETRKSEGYGDQYSTIITTHGRWSFSDGLLTLSPTDSSASTSGHVYKYGELPVTYNILWRGNGTFELKDKEFDLSGDGHATRMTYDTQGRRITYIKTKGGPFGVATKEYKTVETPMIFRRVQ